MSEAEGYELLARYHVPVPKHVIVRDGRDARMEAERIGFPVVMKIVSPDISHKSDMGGVISGIETGEAARESFDAIIDRAKRARPDAAITGVIIE
ncbi:MAG: acetate--CoA ligase family protein, partial [Methanomicrobiales archaeon]|nr:acetate--CoA ligase family protein [Methanomicrobiales archaeon]